MTHPYLHVMHPCIHKMHPYDASPTQIRVSGVSKKWAGGRLQHQHSDVNESILQELPHTPMRGQEHAAWVQCARRAVFEEEEEAVFEGEEEAAHVFSAV